MVTLAILILLVFDTISNKFEITQTDVK